MDRIDPGLLKRYAEGKATEEECAKVEKWLEQEHNLFDQQTEQGNGKLPEKPSENNLSHMWKAFVRRTDEGIRRARYWWWGSRVVLPMLLVVGLGIYFGKDLYQRRAEQVEWLTVEVPKGQRAHLKLSDSTSVYLAGGSKLAYPKVFNNTQRTISLEYGHAFLEVTKDPSRLFLLQSGRVQVKVLGTAFDVTNRINDKSIAVLLKEGSVQFSDNLGLQHILKPGDKVVYHKETGTLDTYADLDVSRVGTWGEGHLYFRQSQLSDVLALLEDRYDVVFKLHEASLATVPVTGTFDDMPLKRILFLLEESTGLSFGQEAHIITVKR